MKRDEELEPPTIFRLNALIAAGYEIDKTSSQKVRDAIWLEHPARKRVNEPTLIIYNDGLVVGDSTANPKKKQLRLNPGQTEEFNLFVQSVPQPNIWEKSQKTLASVVAWGVILFIWMIAYLIINFFISLFRN